MDEFEEFLTQLCRDIEHRFTQDLKEEMHRRRNEPPKQRCRVEAHGGAIAYETPARIESLPKSARKATPIGCSNSGLAAQGPDAEQAVQSMQIMV